MQCSPAAGGFFATVHDIFEARGEILVLIRVPGRADYTPGIESRPTERGQAGWQKGGEPEKAAQRDHDSFDFNLFSEMSSQSDPAWLWAQNSKGLNYFLACLGSRYLTLVNGVLEARDQPSLVWCQCLCWVRSPTSL